VSVPLVGLERDALMAIADDAYRAHRAFTTAKTKVDQLAARSPAAALAPVVGHTTAGVVRASIDEETDALAPRHAGLRPTKPQAR
jgi:hypothetical protein